MIVCATHAYRAASNRPPKETGCVSCWASFGMLMQRHVQKAGTKSVGRAKGGGRSAKAKGRSAAQVVRALILSQFPHLQPDDVLVKATSMGGVDLHLSPAAHRVFPFGIEVKNVESLNIWSALQQADANANERDGVVFFKRANTPMFVALKAEVFLLFLRTDQGYR